MFIQYLAGIMLLSLSFSGSSQVFKGDSKKIEKRPY